MQSAMTAPTAHGPVDRAPPMPGSVQDLRTDVQLLTSVDQFHALRPEWNPLLEQSACRNVFLTWEWNWTWWEIFGERLQPWIVVVRQRPAGRLLGVAPLVRRCRRNGCRELLFLGTTAASGDHLDVLAPSGEQTAVAARIAEFIQTHRDQWDLLALDRIAAGSPLAAALRQRNRQPALVWQSTCPFLRLPARWEDLLPQLDRHLQRRLRTSPKRLAEDLGGAVQYRTVASCDELPAAMEELFRLHQAVRASRGDQGAFCQAAVRDFHRSVAERFLRAGWLRLYLLQVHGETIAAEYCFRYHDTVSFYQTGYDQAWAPYRPGLLIKAHAIRTSIAEGAREYDFLRGAERYKLEWTTTARRDLRMRVPGSVRGSLLVLAYRAIYPLRQRLRQWRGRTENDAGFFCETPSPAGGAEE